MCSFVCTIRGERMISITKEIISEYCLMIMWYSCPVDPCSYAQFCNKTHMIQFREQSSCFVSTKAAPFGRVIFAVGCGLP